MGTVTKTVTQKIPIEKYPNLQADHNVINENFYQLGVFPTSNCFSVGLISRIGLFVLGKGLLQKLQNSKETPLLRIT